MTRSAFVLGAAAAAGLLGCTGDVGPDTSSTDFESFEEFEASTYREDFEGGVYIVNGDTPVIDKKALKEFWESLHADQSLIVNTSGGADTKWSDTQKLNLTYCISNNFGSNKTKVVNAMEQGTGAWESVANVNFTYNSSQDANCTASNSSVTFDIRPVSGQSYVARAFFPNNPRSSRNILIDSQAFGNLGVWTLKGVLTHELGHTLGFRHEHTRPEAGTCFEDNNWRPLTTYDGSSVMHYPQCNGTQNGDLVITSKDAAGAASLYGAPGGNPPPPPPPGGGTPQTGSASGSVAYHAWVRYQPLSVLAGTRFTVNMTGSGDPDLYVRWGSQPTLTAYDSSSVMHYPQCNGTQNGDLVLTTSDKAGADLLY
jgi:hypothetical protein